MSLSTFEFGALIFCCGFVPILSTTYLIWILRDDLFRKIDEMKNKPTPSSKEGGER